MSDAPIAETRVQDPPATLGDVLYAKPKSAPSEQEWVALVHEIAGGDEAALQGLYDRASPPVFTLAMRLTANRETAEEVTLDVFHGIWRSASSYEAAAGTVLAWIMNQARSRAIDRLRFDSRRKRNPAGAQQPEEAPAPNAQDVLELREQTRALQAALERLNASERQAIETTYFQGLSHAEAAQRLGQPLGTIKTRIRSGLHKLRDALAAEQGEP